MTALGIGWTHPAWLLLLPLALLPLLNDSRAPQTHSWLGWLPRDAPSTAWKWLLRALGALAVLGIVCALAGLHRVEYAVERVGKGAEIVLLLDRSRSMDERLVSAAAAGAPTPGTAAWYAYNQADAGPHESKGQAARRLLAEFAARRPDDRFAMAVFSSLPIAVLDFTSKPQAVQAAIGAGDVGRGLGETNIAAAMLQGLSLFDRRAYTGSRIVLLVSDGGDQIEPALRDRLVERLREQRVALYWIYIRSARSASLSTAASPTANADAVPELFLHRFFESAGVPYRAYEAETPEALQRAIADVGRLENLPITYFDVVPRRDLSTYAYAVALAAIALLMLSHVRTRSRWSAAR